MRITKYALFDLDYNSVPELILWLVVNENEYYGFEILRWQDEIVCGYTLWYRAFMELKTDGTFSFSGGASDNGFGRAVFTDDGYSIEKISYCEKSYDIINNNEVLFYVDNSKTTKDRYLEAVGIQANKDDVVWHEYTRKNIEEQLR